MKQLTLKNKMRGRFSHVAQNPLNKSTAKKCAKFFFSHVGLFILVTVYAVAGAYILITFELPEEEKRFEQKREAAIHLKESLTYVTDQAFYLINAHSTNSTLFKQKMKNTLMAFQHYVVDRARHAKYDGYVDSWNYDWTITKSILFTITTMGAIGYGHISPKTTLMRVFTIYYGMIGIPLLLLFLANIGDAMAKAFNYIYSRLCCRWCRIRRKVSEARKKLVPQILWKENVGREPYMPSEFVDVPIMINLLLIFAYLFLGGAIFSYWENWETHEAAYFTFITLTTIGFGDFVPGNSFSVKGNDALSSALKMFATIIFCLLGMALLSMAINLMKEQLVEKVRWMAIEMGVMEEDFDPRIKYNMKRSNDDYIQSTAPERDGNKKNRLIFTNETDDMRTPLVPPFNAI